MNASPSADLSPLLRGLKRSLTFNFDESVNDVAENATKFGAATPAREPDLGRLLNNMTQAAIYRKRMCRRHHSGGSTVGNAGFKKYLRDRYLNSEESFRLESDSSSSRPSVDFESDPFSPLSPLSLPSSELPHQHRHQHRQCSSAPQSAGGQHFVFPPAQRQQLTPAAATAPSTPASGGGHVCPVCARVFARSDMLNRHSRLHSNARPYECQLCRQAFSRSDHLSTHMRTHTGEKPYVCRMCGYAACRRDMITRHMKVHRKHSAASEGEQQKQQRQQ